MASGSHASEPDCLASQQEPLVKNGDVETQPKAKEKVSYSSLPNKKQLAISCVARLADPLAASSIQVRSIQQNMTHANLLDLYIVPSPIL